jgi:cyclopropane fatty-acyl-phospholipid synthase-like methyltransferase
MAAFEMNSFLGKQILSLVRDGDFAHAGEREAIELAMDSVPKDAGQHVLDAGCGRGGTAAHLQQHGWGQVTGMDIDAESIAHAQRAYPAVRFIAGDLHEAAGQLSRTFRVICMFNVLYAMTDHVAALRALRATGLPGAALMIFDYVDRGSYQRKPIEDGRFIPNPPMRSRLSETLAASDWRVQASLGIDGDYERWYLALVQRIEAKRAAIEALVGADGYGMVLGRYDSLLAALRDGRLGGAIIHAVSV